MEDIIKKLTVFYNTLNSDYEGTGVDTILINDYADDIFNGRLSLEQAYDEIKADWH